MKSLMDIQREHNQLIADYNKAQYDRLHVASALVLEDPFTAALQLALLLEEHLDLNDQDKMNWFSHTGAGYEAIWNCIQLLRQLADTTELDTIINKGHCY